MMLIQFAWFFGGLLLLIGGGELLVRGASTLAARFGVSSLVIGLTVVAFGTSSPELAVSLQAGLSGQPDIAAGNAVGSNILNVLFILGISALITPLVVNVQLIRMEVPIMIAASVLLLALALDGRISAIEGVLLAGLLAAYLVFTIVQSRREVAARSSPDDAAVVEQTHWALPLFSIVIGLALLVVGGNWLVGAATYIARAFGVSDLVIALTIVAAGTSMPEVVTSILAALKGERDIAVGNVVGSSIFNILGVLGISAMVTPGGLAAAAALVNFDLPVMIAVALACLPIFFTGLVIARWEGALFLGYYAAYTAYLLLRATEHDALPAYSAVMVGFVIPLTAITLVLIALRTIRVIRTGR